MTIWRRHIKLATTNHLMSFMKRSTPKQGRGHCKMLNTTTYDTCAVGFLISPTHVLTPAYYIEKKIRDNQPLFVEHKAFKAAIDESRRCWVTHYGRWWLKTLPERDPKCNTDMHLLWWPYQHRTVNKCNWTHCIRTVNWIILRILAHITALLSSDGLDVHFRQNSLSKWYSHILYL